MGSQGNTLGMNGLNLPGRDELRNSRASFRTAFFYLADSSGHSRFVLWN